MPTLRFIAAILASGLCALALSVGAAFAEGQRPPAAAQTAHVSPAALCLLEDGKRAGLAP